VLVLVAVALLVFVLPSPWGYLVLALALAAEIGELFMWRRLLGRYRVVTGAEGLVGEVGEVLEACEPAGSVRLRGEIWKARCDHGAAPGERVAVERVEGLMLHVALLRAPR